MKPNDYFFRLYEIEPLYETENVFFEPFWEFQYRFQSLQRHWELNREYIHHYISMLKKVEGDGTAEFDVMFSETAGIDINYFPEYLRSTTITLALSLVEDLLGNLSIEVAKDLGVEIDLDQRPMPYIDKYILWLNRGCGLEIDIEKTLWRNLNAIRQLRNRFIHNIDKDIPDQIKKTISEMMSIALEDEELVTDDFVDESLYQLADLAKRIEIAYIKFYDNEISKQTVKE